MSVLADVVDTIGAVVELRGFERDPPWLVAIDASPPVVACSWQRRRFDHLACLEADRSEVDRASVLHDGRYSLHLAGETHWFNWHGRFRRDPVTRMLVKLVDEIDEEEPPEQD